MIIKAMKTESVTMMSAEEWLTKFPKLAPLYEGDFNIESASLSRARLNDFEKGYIQSMWREMFIFGELTLKRGFFELKAKYFSDNDDGLILERLFDLFLNSFGMLVGTNRWLVDGPLNQYLSNFSPEIRWEKPFHFQIIKYIDKKLSVEQCRQVLSRENSREKMLVFMGCHHPRLGALSLARHVDAHVWAHMFEHALFEPLLSDSVDAQEKTFIENLLKPF